MDEVELEARLKQIEQRLAKLEPEPAIVQPKPAPNGDLTWQQVSGAFAKRYREARQLEWFSGPHVQHLMDITDSLNRQPGDIRENGKTLMDNFFADSFARKVDFPPAMLAKQFGKFLRPPEEDGKVDREKRLQRAEESERHYQIAKRKAEEAHAKKVALKMAQDPEQAEANWAALKDILEGE